jgi:hypothetical protein
MQSLEAQGKTQEAKVIQNQWLSVWANADIELSMPVVL